MLDASLIGKRIKELRKQRGITQSEFAEAIYVSFQAVSNWERGIAPPDLDNLVRIANYFNVLTDDILRKSYDGLVLGIDGGGTKTEFVVSTEDGKVLKRIVCSGTNPNDIGLQGAISILTNGIRTALTEYPSICSVFCGIAGITTGDNRQRILEALSESFPPLTINAGNDSSNLFATDDTAEMALISGTGSVVFVKNKEGCFRIGGWGYLLDPGGSAYDIGRDALRVALTEEDAGEDPCIMTRLLKEKLETDTIWGIINKIYCGGKPYIASLSNVVFNAYEMEDEKAIAIVSENATRLAELINLGIKRYHATPRVVAGGGILENHWDIMISHIKKHTDAELVLCDLPQVYGACRQAVRMHTGKISGDFYKNFKTSYGGAL